MHICKTYMGAVKNIIFDLGGVIINLDTHRTIRAFNALALAPFEQIYTQTQQTTLFDAFDKGTITEAAFFEGLRPFLKQDVTLEQMKTAWNAMLLDFPQHRLDLLLNLKNKCRTFLLSNTNETHIDAFEHSLFETQRHKNLEPFFEKVYYSCRMGMRKPDPVIFESVLNENGLSPEETVFIDDTEKHVIGARQCGINAYLLEPGKDISVLLKDLQLI